MDGLAALLDGPRARGAFWVRCLLAAPWAVRLEDESPLSLTAVVRGTAWVVPDRGPVVRLGPGDVVVARGPDHWSVADTPGTPPFATVLPGQICVTPDGRELAEELHQGVRSWGNAAVGDTVLLTGAYLLDGEVSARLLRALPPRLVLRAADLDSPLVGLLADEVGKDAPGQDAVLDRLLDLVLITVLRAWFDRPEADPPGWYVGQGDPVVGPALRLVQHHPDRAWTVADLAAAGGVSRAAFARRFAAVVGVPPMAFLTEWRLALAADLLLDPDATVAAVARQVGYATPFALSAAFKRARGVSPREHRRQAAGRAPAAVRAQPSG